ncbi:DUF624 domain-containing protein [Fundicoccus sp. Sow4_H7]|uniref:DUF624 domain-containing protein n=1 Tax=Fundicoccus sp. Sow4_H7 TaxID=3438784 RepID=UPI003F8FADC4
MLVEEDSGGGIIQNAFVHLLNWVGRLVYLNILWIIFSLPLVTVIPSSFALIYLMTESINHNKAISFKKYLQAFRSNLKDSYYFSLPIVGVILLIWLDLKIVSISNYWF